MPTAKQIPTDPPTFDPNGNPRFKRMKLDPELGDGEHWTVHEATGMDAVLSAWLEEAQPGDVVVIKVVSMSDDEVAAVPEI